jgi:hypothetical protein
VVRKPCPTNLERQSGARFENEIEWSLCGAPEFEEAAIHYHGAQSSFARLCAQAQTDFLRARSRCANESRGLEGLADVRRGADRITHVVQTV